MPLSRVQTPRSGVTGGRPAAPNGGLYTNTADRQLGMRGFDGTVLDLLAVTRHSEHPAYAAGALVALNGNIYKCRAPTTGVFDATKWWNLSAGPAITTMAEPAGPHRDGELWLDRNPSAGAQLKVWVAETSGWNIVGTDRMPFTGGTFTGMVSHPFTPTAQDHVVRKKYVDDTLLGFVPKSSPYSLDRIQLATSGPGSSPSLQFGTTGTGLHLYSTGPEPFFIVGGANRAKVPPATVAGMEGLSLLTMALADQLYLPFGASLYTLSQIALTQAGSALAPSLRIGSGTGFFRTAGGRLAVARDGVFAGAFMDAVDAGNDEYIRRDYADGRYLRAGLSGYNLGVVYLTETNTGISLQWAPGTGMRKDPSQNTPYLYVDGDLVARFPEPNAANDGPTCLVTQVRGDARYQRVGVGTYKASGRVSSAGDLSSATVGSATSASRLSTGHYRVNGNFNGYSSVMVTLWGGSPEDKCYSLSAVTDSNFEVIITNAFDTPLNHGFQFTVF
jgi:hypothetical protein